jgi:hypothetical protein
MPIEKWVLISVSGWVLRPICGMIQPITNCTTSSNTMIQ